MEGVGTSATLALLETIQRRRAEGRTVWDLGLGEPVFPAPPAGVRAAIEQFKPVLGVHGHIHESGGERRIGSTVCVNAGSESSMGVLRGYLVDLSANGVERTLRVEG